MALLRSEILNRELAEAVLKKKEGTRRVTVTALTVGHIDRERSSLLEERLSVEVDARVKGHEKTYPWIAKVLKAEFGAANYARFQGILETEIAFYEKLVPSLVQLDAPLPLLFPRVHSDYQTLNREVLILEDLSRSRNLSSPIRSKERTEKEGLDFAHVILAVEWLAKLHGLGYVLLQKHPKGHKGWLAENPWIRKADEDQRDANERCKSDDQSNEKKADEHDGIRARLVDMAVTAIRSEVSGEEKLATLLERQDWLDNLRKEMWTNEQDDTSSASFRTICHGEPWYGNALFSYPKGDDDHRPSGSPREAVLGDLHACSYGRPGADLAHFMLTSTTRQFRKAHLDTVLEAYHAQLEDVVQSQGLPSDLYPMSLLQRDYRQGLMLGITFCLFAMPMLTKDSDDDDDDVAKRASEDEDVDVEEVDGHYNNNNNNNDTADDNEFVPGHLSEVVMDRLVGGLRDIVLGCGEG